MFARYLYIDDRRKIEALPPNADLEAELGTKDPTWDQVAGAIESFDTRHIRMIVVGEFAPDEDETYPFGGRGIVLGKSYISDEYTIDYYNPSEEICYSFVDASRGSSPLTQVLIGQAGETSPSSLCSKATTMEIARRFYESGERLESVEWHPTRGL